MARKTSGKAIERVAEQSVDPFRSPIDAWITPANVSPAFLVTGASIVYGAAFQLGYFSHVGMHFLQLAGPLDILFVVAAVVPVFFVLWPLLSFTQTQVTRHIESGQSKLVALCFSWLRYEYFLFGALIFTFVLFDVDLTNAFQFSAFVVTLVLCLLNWASLKSHYQYYREIAPTTLFWVSINAFLLFWFAGALYARNLAGQECFVRTTDKAFWHARYLRSIGDGHLLMYKSQSIYLAKNELKEMFCGKPRGAEPTDSSQPDFIEPGKGI